MYSANLFSFSNPLAHTPHAKTDSGYNVSPSSITGLTLVGDGLLLTGLVLAAGGCLVTGLTLTGDWRLTCNLLVWSSSSD